MTGEERHLSQVVIIGGGSAGWMAAAALARAIETNCTITLIESELIGTLGVGEGTIPRIKDFNRFLGIDENEFVRRTQGAFKLGVHFVDWAKLGRRYFHPFGSFGRQFDAVEPHFFWLREHNGDAEASFDDYCMAWAAASRGRFAPPSNNLRHVLSTHEYAYHFDASLYGAFLRTYAEARGVKRVEGKVVQVIQNEINGFVESVTLDDGRSFSGDLFIDCSGFRSLLLGATLGVEFEDWSHWLPCDRAMAVPSIGGGLTPYTRSTARAAGWQWRIPLQHRIGNGYVYSSAHISDDEAARVLLENLDGEPIADPRPIRFQSGRRARIWEKNVVAIGLAGGFVEPLESTAIYLVQSAITRLLRFFPDLDFDADAIAEFNRGINEEFDRIRDFLILHYHLTERDDSELWRSCAAMEVPDTLKLRIEHFRRYGRHVGRDADIFGSPSWVAVNIGQLNWPERLDPLIDFRKTDGSKWLGKVRAAMAAAADTLPTHRAYVDQHCKAAPEALASRASGGKAPPVSAPVSA
jgi:tryptophan halogenase